MFGVPASNLYGRSLYVGLLEGDRADHVAAALVRRHRFEQLCLAVEHADAGGPEQLVPGEGVEIAVERLHVDLHVRHGLRAVHQHRNVPRGAPCSIISAHRIDRAERVRDVRERHQPRALRSAAFSNRSSGTRPRR